MQAFVLQDEGGLAGGIEFFFSTIAHGEMFLAGLHLAGGGEGANQNFFGVGDLGFGRGFHRGCGARGGGVAEFLAEDRAESMPSFCAIS